MATFSIFDYVLFFCTLAISIIIGIYYAIKAKIRTRKCKASGSDKNDEAGEFLMGGRRMPLIPTALSLLVSFVSGISMISYPSEIYTMGTGFCWTIIGGVCGVFISGIFILPVIYPLPSMSIYAYLEERFQSHALRVYASISFQSTNLVYTSVVLYAPSMALSGVTGIELCILLVILGAVCTIYTSIGGLKAVVWTDAFQALIMYAGLLSMVIKGTIAADGIGSVYNISRDHGRFKGFLNFDPNPLQYTTVWSSYFGGIFFGLSIFGCNQIALQRYCSLPSLTQARVVIFANIPMLITVFSLVFYIGLIMLAYSAKCLWTDGNFEANSIDKDQLVIYYMLDLLGSTYGLPGLYIACIFSATLSTVSSSINSLSAVLFDDFIKPLTNRKRLNQGQIAVITKLIAAMYGVLSVCLAFGAQPLGGALRVVTGACGAIAGPLVGLILLGILFPWANRYGAIIGTASATCIDFWIFIGAQVHNVQYPSLAVPGCNLTIANSSDQWNHTIDRRYTPELHGIDQIYALSFVMHACVGGGLTLIIGLVASFVTGCDDTATRRPELIFWTRGRPVKVEIDEKPLNGYHQSLPDLRKRAKHDGYIYDKVQDMQNF